MKYATIFLQALDDGIKEVLVTSPFNRWQNSSSGRLNVLDKIAAQQ